MSGRLVLASPSSCAPARRGLRFAAAVLALATALCLPTPGVAKVFHSQEEALELAFPDCDELRDSTHVLTPEQVGEIEAMARAKLESAIVRLHSGWKGGELVGHALIEVHNVRTKSEAFMIVMNPAGEVRSLLMLAFHEPQDYLPPDRWFRRFVGMSLRDDMRVGRDLHAVVGSTLSTRAVADAVRRALAIHAVLVRNEKSKG